MRPVLFPVLVAGIACATNPAPVPVAGAASDVSALVGEWSGEYHSPESGRSGSILFKLAPGRDTANGDVVMVNRETGMSHDDAVQVALARQAANQVLRIRFVRVSGATVNGTIDPYQSPDCNCQLATVFRGEIRGNRIEGTFRTVQSGPETVVQQGTWWVAKK